MKMTVFALAAACLFGGFVSAHAAEQGDSTVVRYSEVDLRQQQGATALVGRIRGAAKMVCGPRPNLTLLADHDRYVDCLQQAAGSAIERLGAPLVTTAYRNGAQRLTLSQR